jgi:hypothetical protein
LVRTALVGGQIDEELHQIEGARSPARSADESSRPGTDELRSPLGVTEFERAAQPSRGGRSPMPVLETAASGGLRPPRGARAVSCDGSDRR